MMSSSYLTPCRVSFLFLFYLMLLPSMYFSEEGSENGFFHVLNISRLMPSTTCSNPQGQWQNNASYMIPVLRPYGPCNPLGNNVTLDQFEVLLDDEKRLRHLLRKLSSNNSYTEDPLESKSTFSIQKGTSIGTGNFVTTVGLGTPMVNQTVILDTGSGLSWVQCDPYCSTMALTCYPQQEGKYHRFRSTTYGIISCRSLECSQLEYPDCLINRFCKYRVEYSDRSTTVGYLGREVLSLSPTEVIPDFVFGCGIANRGIFGKSTGLIGLSKDPLSMISQFPSSKGKIFSYCLPITASSTGHFTIGPSGGTAENSSFSYTPMLNFSRAVHLYALELTGISVSGHLLPIPPTVFSVSGTIIDSGSVITRLPPLGYSALRTAFREGMIGYPPPGSFSILDTCYNISGMTTIRLPPVAFYFGGGMRLDLHDENVIWLSGDSQACLAFAGNLFEDDPSIIGNVLQKGWEVVYDLESKRIGFGLGNC